MYILYMQINVYRYVYMCNKKKTYLYALSWWIRIIGFEILKWLIIGNIAQFLFFFLERICRYANILAFSTHACFILHIYFFSNLLLLSSILLCDGGLTHLVGLFLSWPWKLASDTLLCRSL